MSRKVSRGREDAGRKMMQGPASLLRSWDRNLRVLESQ